MPHAYSDLEFWASPDGPPDPSLLPPPASGIPTRLERGGRILNFGLLAGELLGIDTGEARRTVDALDMLPESIAHVFLEEDLAILLDAFARVRDALSAAVDSEGRAKGENGQRLAEHPTVGRSADGRLFFRSQHVDIADLRADLDTLHSFLAWAATHELLVSKSRPS